MTTFTDWESGCKVHLPYRDVEQDDETGYYICLEHFRASERTTMCEQCLAECVRWEVHPFPGIALVRATKDGNTMKEGDYGLVRMNDPFLIVPCQLLRNPLAGMTDEQIDALEDDGPEMQRWWAFSRECEKVPYDSMDAMDAYELIVAMMALGYDPVEDGRDWTMWLVHYLAGFVEGRQPISD